MNDQEILLEIRDRITKVERYLYNDEDTGKDGIVKTQERHDRRITLLEELNTIRKAKATTWGGIGGAISLILYKVIEYLITKIA